jgi:hypothetical protein
MWEIRPLRPVGVGAPIRRSLLPGGCRMTCIPTATYLFLPQKRLILPNVVTSSHFKKRSSVQMMKNKIPMVPIEITAKLANFVLLNFSLKIFFTSSENRKARLIIRVMNSPII